MKREIFDLLLIGFVKLIDGLTGWFLFFVDEFCLGRAFLLLSLFCNRRRRSITLTGQALDFPAIFLIDIELSSVVEKHSHSRLQVVEARGINFANLLVGYTLPHD